MSLDYGTWRKLVKAFRITEPLIPHRVEGGTQVVVGAWYG
jgi:hypothetical protein